jgi:hypothetical protein
MNVISWAIADTAIRLLKTVVTQGRDDRDKPLACGMALMGRNASGFEGLWQCGDGLDSH